MKRLLTLIVVFAITTMSTDCFSAVFAYLYTRSNIIKMDVFTNSIINTISTDTQVVGFIGVRNRAAVIDINRNNLLTGLMRGDFGFNVYSASTLKKDRFVSFPGVNSDIFDYRFIYPPVGNYFHVLLENEDTNNVKTLTYSKSDFSVNAGITNILASVNDNFWFSENDVNVFVEHNKKIYIYDTISLALSNTIPLSNVLSEKHLGYRISDISGNRLLAVETHQPQSQDQIAPIYSFFIYDLITNAKTNSVNYGFESFHEFIVPGTNLVVVDEIVYSNQLLMEGPVLSLKLHLFDTLSGTRIKTIEFPKTGLSGTILGFSPLGEKLYFIQYSDIKNENILYAINMNDFGIINRLKVPKIKFIEFTDEPDEAPAQ